MSRTPNQMSTDASPSTPTPNLDRVQRWLDGEDLDPPPVLDVEAPQVETSDDPPATGPVRRPWRLLYRVLYWREHAPAPQWEVVASLPEAERRARKVARRKGPGEDGPITRIVIEERLVSDWTVYEVVRDSTAPAVEPEEPEAPESPAPSEAVDAEPDDGDDQRLEVD